MFEHGMETRCAVGWVAVRKKCMNIRRYDKRSMAWLHSEDRLECIDCMETSLGAEGSLGAVQRLKRFWPANNLFHIDLSLISSKVSCSNLSSSSTCQGLCLFGCPAEWEVTELAVSLFFELLKHRHAQGITVRSARTFVQ